MSITPTSSIAKALSSAKTLLATSATFRQHVGAPSVDIAKGKIYLYETWSNDEDLSAIRPFASITLEPGTIYRPIFEQGSCVNWFVELAVNIHLESPAHNGPASDISESIELSDDSYLEFLNFCGGVLEEIGELVSTDIDTFGFRAAEIPFEPERTDPFRRGDSPDNDFWQVDILLHNRGAFGG